MKKQNKLVMLVAALIFGLTVFSIPVQGEETTSSSSAGGFYYEVVKPENQVNQEAGYFDLRMKPGQQQTVHINFTNNKSSDITLEIGLNGAKTNQNGVIEYGQTELKNDPSLKYPFEEVVSAPEELLLPAETTTKLELNVAMPKEKFDGVIAGGIYFQMKEKDAEETSGVVHKTAYMVGMLLTENDTKVAPDLQLNDVYPKLRNYRGAIYVDFSNVTATFIGGITVDTSIAAKNKPKEVLYDSKTAGMEMAPNSYLTYPVSLNGNPYVAGDYIADITVTSGEKEWKWKKEFTITQEEADKLNEEDVGLIQEQGINWLLIAAAAVGVLLVIAGIYFLIRIKKKSSSTTKS